MIGNRQVGEFIEAAEPSSTPKRSEKDNLSMEHLNGIAITLNGEDVETPIHLDEEGRVKKLTPEYLFMKRLCGRCTNRLYEGGDPRKGRWTDWSVKVDSNTKYGKFYDKRGDNGNYYSAMLRRNLSVVCPMEFLCKYSIGTDPMKPSEKVIKDMDILKCNLNLPKNYGNSRDYFLAFKKNFTFFNNLLPVKLTEITEERYNSLIPFGKYGFRSVMISLHTLGSYPEYSTAVYKCKNEELPLPPMLEGHTIDVDGGYIIYDNWIDHTSTEQVIKDIFKTLDVEGVESGTYYYTIDNMVILKATINIEKDAFKDISTYSIMPVVVDANANNIECGVDDQDLPWCKEKEDRSDQRTEMDPIDSYRFDVEFVQICD